MDNPHHRRIDLQSPADLTYLLANIRASALAHLDRDIPPTTGTEDDAFRQNVERRVNDYIHRTLELALPSISVNGLDADPALIAGVTASATKDSAVQASGERESFEPYDSRLAAQVRALYATLEAETTRLAELRREAPAKAAAMYAASLQAELAQEELRFSAAVEKVRMEGVQEGGKALEGVTLERHELVTERYHETRRALEQSKGITGVGARLERAKGVVQGLELS